MKKPEAPSLVLPLEIPAYLEHLVSIRRLAAHSIHAYRRDLSLLARFADTTALEQVTQAQAQQWLAQLHYNHLSAHSIARILSAWRGFYKWLAQRQALALNPMQGLRPPKAPQPLPNTLAPDLTQALVSLHNSSPLDANLHKLGGVLQTPQVASRPSKNARATPSLERAVSSAEVTSSKNSLNQGLRWLRDRALLELLYSSGLRLAELLSVDIQFVQTRFYKSRSWLALTEAEVNVLGKGSKQRTVPVGQAALLAIQAWLAVRGQWHKPNVDSTHTYALFISERGLRLGARAVQLRVAYWAKKLGLPTHVHPHMLRHAFASHLLQSSGDLRAVQELLGHANIRTTQIYTKLDFQHLAKVYDAAHPRARRSITALIKE